MPATFTIPLSRIYPSQALSSICAFVFALLVSLRADGFIKVSIWVVFIPNFLLDAACILGAVVGYVVYRREAARGGISQADVLDIKAMLSTAALFPLKLAFEIMLCLSLSGTLDVHGMVVFFPLLLMSLLAWVVVWYQRRLGRSIFYELVLAINFLQLLFLALRVSEIVTWRWQNVFIPTWIALGCHGCYVLFCIGAFSRSACAQDVTVDERVDKGARALTGVIYFAPTVTFIVLLCEQLENQLHNYYSLVTLPLLLTIAFVIWMSFLQNGGNPWWFGLCTYAAELRGVLPDLGRTAYMSVGDDRNRTGSINEEQQSLRDSEEGAKDKEDAGWKAPPPYLSIMTPD